MAKKQDIEVYRPVIWVVGASRGIGKEVAKQFSRIGCRVCLSSRTIKGLKRTVDEIHDDGGIAHQFPCDITRSVDVVATVARIRKQIGDIDVLVNNAGVTVFKSFLNTSLEEFDEILDTNLRGPIICTKAVLPAMVKRRKGWIINILSNAAVKTFTDSSAYTATKSGMLGMGKVLREELKGDNIRVINVIPGATHTEMWSAASRKKFAYRMMQPKSVAEAVLAAFQMPDDLVVDELIVRPMQGDIE